MFNKMEYEVRVGLEKEITLCNAETCCGCKWFGDYSDGCRINAIPYAQRACSFTNGRNWTVKAVRYMAGA